MNNKQYPTRMHEVLGVETGERFKIERYSRSEEFYLLGDGTLTTDRAVCYQGVLVEIINHPERIIRKPRLTQEQVKRLRALIALEAIYLAKNKDGSVGAFTNKPTKNALYWNANDSYCFYLSIVGTCLSDLVSWSDPEPLDIVAALRESGVKVE